MPDQEVEIDGPLDTVTTRDPNMVYLKKANGALPLDLPLVATVTRHFRPLGADKVSGLAGHTLVLKDRTTDHDIEIKFYRTQKQTVICVDGEEIIKLKKNDPPA